MTSKAAPTPGTANDRLRIVVGHLTATRRLVRPIPVVVASVAGAVAVWRLELAGDGAEVAMAVAFAIGVAPALSDPAAVTLAPSPTSRPRRAITRLALVLPPAVACWIAARAVTGWAVAGDRSLADPGLWAPGWDPVLVVGTAVLLALAVEAMTGGASDVPGLRGSITVLVASAVALFLPPSLAVSPVESFRWRWLAVAAFGGLLLWRSVTDRGWPRSSIHPWPTVTRQARTTTPGGRP